MRTMSGGPCLHYDCTNRNSFGYCKTTACINENYRHEEWFSTSNRTDAVIVKPKTNADRIRAMSDEELAEWIATDLIEPGYNSYNATYGKWLDWLRQEATP